MTGANDYAHSRSAAGVRAGWAVTNVTIALCATVNSA
jgi:hypothetical protein